MTKKNIIILIIALVLPIIIIILSVFIHKHKHRYRGKRINRIEHYQKPDPKQCVHPDGIDLSHHNIAYDWGKVDAKFIYVRATMGSNIKDKRYDVHRKAALRHKIPMGAYHFLTAKTSAKIQFDNFKEVVSASHIQLRPMLDVEETKYWSAPSKFSDEDAHDLIRKWCDLCKETYGIAPIIYTTEKLYQRFKLHKGFDDCIWWVANYNNIKDYEKKCKIPYTIHQYSDNNYVEGFYGKIDCNRFRTGKSINDLKK